MAGFDDIAGQESLTAHFENAIKLNKISHAYIINGEMGMGKRTIARAFSMTLQCERKGRTPCMECHSCRQAMTNNNPDIRWVTHEKPSVISVGEIRSQINNDVQIKPYANEYKIYIVEDASLMNTAAQNSLLKTVEEPPPYVVIMLLTDNKEMLLQTILSRCVVMELRPVKKQVLERYLIEKAGIADYKAREVSGFAGGNIGKAIRMASSDDFEALRESVASVAKNIGKMTIADIGAAVKAAAAYKDSINEYLDLLLAWYRDVLVYKACGDKGKVLYGGYIKHIRTQAQAFSYSDIESVLEELDGARGKLKLNVNFDMVIQLLFMTMRDCFAGQGKP